MVKSTPQTSGQSVLRFRQRLRVVCYVRVTIIVRKGG